MIHPGRPGRPSRVHLLCRRSSGGPAGILVEDGVLSVVYRSGRLGFRHNGEWPRFISRVDSILGPGASSLETGRPGPAGTDEESINSRP